MSVSRSPADVSVVIPSFNARKTIGRAIGSVLRQTTSVREIIVVDDGSTDDTAKLIEDEFPQAALIRQANRGFAGARNAGIRAAAGEYLAFLDADDLWLEHKVRLQMSVLDQAPQVGLVCGPTIWSSPTGEWPADAKVPPGHYSRPLADVFANHRIRTSAALIRRCVVDQVGLMDETLLSSEDTDFFWRIAASGWKVAYTRAALTVGFNVAGRATTDLTPVGRTLVACLDRWDPDTNAASPLTVKEFARARTAALLAAGEYATADGLLDEARGYFRAARAARGGPVTWRVMARLGAAAPGLLGWGLTLRRRLTGRRPLGT